MGEVESALAKVERHVREGEARVARQEEIIAEMERDNHPEAAAMGREVLASFQRTLQTLRGQLSLLRGQGGGGADPRATG